MADLEQLPLVKQGLWFCGGVTACHVQIVQSHTLCGSGDANDPPELARDRLVDCYQVRFDTPRHPEQWQDGGVGLSVREAVFLAECKLGPLVSWSD